MKCRRLEALAFRINNKGRLSGITAKTTLTRLYFIYLLAIVFIMGWNHRILAHKDGEDWFFQIHEVYYDEKGKPNSYTANGVSVGAESVEGVNWVLDKMKECANKPILSVDNFPNEWSSSGV